MPRTSLHLLPSLLLALAGCQVGDLSDMADPGTSGDPSDGTGGDSLDCEPHFTPLDPASLEACCTEFTDAAHCVPDGTIPAEISDLLGPCDSGGHCVPDEFITTGGLVELKECTFHLDGTPGRCLSSCIPQVQENYGLLQQDVCDLDERCVPCVRPLDGLPTGACEVDLTCDAADGSDDDDGGGGSEPPPAPMCPYEGPPIIDPSTLPACNLCEGAHCVDNALVPGDFADRLAACDADSKCVPDEFIVTAGNTIPDTCASVAGAEGRCLSRCLPEVADQADLLPQSTCAPTQLCVPCFSPLDGSDTGACTLSCDVGPSEPPTQFASCCEAEGKCVPADAIPDDQEGNLDADECEELSGDGTLCVPNQILADGPFTPCEASGLFIGDYTGICLSDCLDFGLQGAALSQGNCDDGFTCAPCIDPLSGEPTGAPGCE